MDEPGSGAWTSSDALVVHHEPARLRASLGAVFLSLLSLAIPVTTLLTDAGGPAPGWVALACLVAVTGTTALAVRHARGRKGAASAVTADTRGVHVGGTLALARADIAYGFVEPAQRGARVQLRDASHGLRLEVRVKDAREGQSLLRALGLDVSQRVAPFFAASPLGGARGLGVSAGVAVAMWFALLFLLPGYNLGSALADDIASIFRMAFPALFMLSWAALAAVPTRVTVGADGLHVAWLRRKRFVPYRDIVRVVPAFGQLRVVLSDGTTLRLRGQRRSFTPQTRPEHRAMVDRLTAAIEEHLARSREQEAVAQLPAPRQDAAGWRRELDALEVGAEGGYRRAVVNDEALWRAVEDVSLDEKTRAGAAVALRKVLDGEGRARLRVVAEAAASPRLRVALEAASGDVEEAIEQSLADLVRGDGDAGQRRRAREA